MNEEEKEQQKETLLAVIEDSKKEMELLEIYYQIFERAIQEVTAPMWKLQQEIRVKFSTIHRLEQILKGTYLDHAVDPYRTSPTTKSQGISVKL